MQIANPIYGVVFRYLMEDNKVAKLIIGALIGEDVVELVFKPHERSFQYEGILTVLRMDFAATIKTPGGTKQVLIELQKAKYYLEVMRFRRYLGEQYSGGNNKIERKKGGAIIVDGIPLLPIYILGEKITEEKIPVLRVGRRYIDVATQKEYDFKHEFVEALTHDGIFVQIPHLKNKRRTELEDLLHIFDQSNINKYSNHILEINESEYPEKYRLVIRRLKQAVAKKKVINQMRTEDELIEVFRHTERELEAALRRAEEVERKAEETERKAEKEKSAKIKLMLKLKELGLSPTEIAASAGMSVEEVNKLFGNG